MNYPSIYFIDDLGIKLPDEDGYQYHRQYGGNWYVECQKSWNGGVGLIGEQDLFPLSKISSNRWGIPDNHPMKKEVATRAGSVTAVLLDTNSQPIIHTSKARLWINPGGLSESDLNNMITEIGILAISVGSLVSHTFNAYIGDSAREDLDRHILPGKYLLSDVKALLELYQSIYGVWTEIEKRPLKTFNQEILAVDITKKVNSPQATIARKLKPEKRQLIAMASTESFNCFENEFLCYILDVCLHDTASALMARIENILIEDDDFSLDNERFTPRNNSQNKQDFKKIKVTSFLDEAKNRYYNDRRYRVKKETESIKQLLASLHECIEWSKEARQYSFLRNIRTPLNSIVDVQRLIKSPTYGIILEAYHQYNGGYSANFTHLPQLYREIISLGVKKTWEVYEIWCFVKLYTALATELRLRTPSHAQNLFESIKLQNGEMSIPKNQEFQLEGVIGKKIINVSLWYEAEDNDLRPDFKLKIMVDNLEKIYYFDAKYRNYTHQTVDRFVSDIIDVAKNKYLDRLGGKTSFILHSDRQFDFWGETSLEEFIKQKFTQKPTNPVETGYVNHRYGAINFTPGVSVDLQIRRLIRLIFQYHDNFCTTCLSCGCEAETQTNWIPDLISEDELKKRIVNREPGGGQSVAIYCSCKECGDFWVVQRCRGHQHRLLKFANSFHQRSPNSPPNKWLYLCPECGGDFTEASSAKPKPALPF